MQKTWDAGSIPRWRRSPGGRHGSPLQDSCLENPTDRGAWHATVHGVTQSQTWLKQLSTLTPTHLTMSSYTPALIPGACERGLNVRKDCISMIILRVVRRWGCPEKQCDHRGPRGRETIEKGLHPGFGERGGQSGGEQEGPVSPGPSAGTSPAKPLVLAQETHSGCLIPELQDWNVCCLGFLTFVYFYLFGCAGS